MTPQIPPHQIRPGYYDHLDFNSPMSEATAQLLVSRLAKYDPRTIVDIGCGWAELLLRLLAACPEAGGHGVDNDLALIERAGTNATERGLADRVRFTAELSTPAPADLALCLGSEHVFGTAYDALSALVDWVQPGGTLLFGSLIWEQPPSTELEAEFGELPNLIELTDHAGRQGWRMLGLKTSSLDDWDDFEFRFAADWEQVVMSGATGPDAERARRKADEYLPAYLQRRGVLGFAFVTLGRPG